MKAAAVAVVMGSISDRPVMEKAADVLDELGVGYEMRVLSAHRTPSETVSFASGAAERGVKVIICGAGMAAHLAGVVSSHTPLPVIGVPMASGSFSGMDALLSTVNMPPGVPVATMGVGSPGAKNAAILAARILALSDEDLARRLTAYVDSMRRSVLEADEQVREGGRS